MQIETVNAVSTEELVALYDAVGWTTYTVDAAALTRAVCASTQVFTARRDGRLVGLARVLSDEVSIAYLQDILVHPDAQRMGVGRALMEACLARFSDVRAFVLMTDDRPQQLTFYASLGLSNTRTLTQVQLNTFVRFKGMTLQ